MPGCSYSLPVVVATSSFGACRQVILDLHVADREQPRRPTSIPQACEYEWVWPKKKGADVLHWTHHQGHCQIPSTTCNNRGERTCEIDSDIQSCSYLQAVACNTCPYGIVLSSGVQCCRHHNTCQCKLSQTTSVTVLEYAGCVFSLFKKSLELRRRPYVFGFKRRRNKKIPIFLIC